MAAVSQPMQPMQQVQFSLANPLHPPTMPRGSKDVALHDRNVQVYTNDLSNRFNAMQGNVRTVDGKDRRSVNLTVEQQAQLLTMTNGAFRNHLANFVDNFENLLRISKKITKQAGDIRSDEVKVKTVTGSDGQSRSYYLTSTSAEDFMNAVIIFIRISKKVFRFNKKLARRDTVTREVPRYVLFERGYEIINNTLQLITGFDDIKNHIYQYLHSDNMTRANMSSVIWMIIKMQESIQHSGIIRIISSNNWFNRSPTGRLVRNKYHNIDELLRQHPMPQGSYIRSAPDRYGVSKYSKVAYYGNQALQYLLNQEIDLDIHTEVEQYSDGNNKYDMKVVISDVPDQRQEGRNIVTRTVRDHIQYSHRLKSDFESDVLNRDQQARQRYQAELAESYQNPNATNVGKLEHKVASYMSRNINSQKQIQKLNSNDDKITAEVSNIISILGYNVDQKLNSNQLNNGKSIISDMNATEGADELNNWLELLNKYHSSYINMENRVLRSVANVAAPNVAVTSSNL